MPHCPAPEATPLNRNSAAIAAGCERKFACSAILRGSKCEPFSQAKAKLPPKYGCSTATETNGTAYFLDLTNDSSTPRTAILRETLPGTCGMTKLENHSGRQAYQEIMRLLDSNHDGNLSGEEKRQVRIVLYGHSWGASEAVALARTLQKDSVDVLC